MVCGKKVHYNRKQLRVRMNDGTLHIILTCNECYAAAEAKISAYLLGNPAGALAGGKVEK